MVQQKLYLQAEPRVCEQPVLTVFIMYFTSIVTSAPASTMVNLVQGCLQTIYSASYSGDLIMDLHVPSRFTISISQFVKQWLVALSSTHVINAL